MKLRFKQRFFSWLDSYDIFGENGEIAYTVKGQFAFAHTLKVFDAQGAEVGLLEQKIFTFLPKFIISVNGEEVGEIAREFTFFKPKYRIDFKGWSVSGDFFEWDYTVTDENENTVATVSKEIWEWTDTYTIDVKDPADALNVLMLVLAIDAEKCSRNN